GEHIKEASAIDPASMKSYAKLHAALLERGVYAAPSGYEVGFVCAAHTDALIDRVAGAFCSALDEVM
ncbi:MAG: aspartate aminotransferase family protein, partial [Flavobacteriales bacterium]|nr:aspartate aminotransferase family protein [Flavobacteriales bacterium]